MNGIYFLVPFLVVAGLGIYQDATAVESFRGYDYSITVNQDGSYTRTIGLPPYIYNNATDSYEPYIHSMDNGNEIVQTEHGSVMLDSAGVFHFYRSGIINNTTPLFSDRIYAKIADAADPENWNYVSVVNNAPASVSFDGTTMTSSKFVTGIGLLEYKYILNNGKWKTQLEATNLSIQTTKLFGFDQILDLNRDTINFGGVQRNLDAFDGTTFNRNWIENNEANLVDFMNGFYFDFDIAFDNLNSITVQDTGLNKSRLIFDFRTSTTLQPNETLVLDPTFGAYDDLSSSRGVINPDGCIAADGDESYQSTINDYLYITDGTGQCNFNFLHWDISNIPSSALVTDVVFHYDIVTSATHPERICSYIKVVGPDANPLTTTATNAWDAILTGDEYVSNDSGCTTTGTGKTLDMGTAADARINALINANKTYWGFGIRFYDLTENGFFDVQFDDATYQLTLTYDMPPDPPKQFSGDVLPNNGVDTSWLAGETNGDTHNDYTVQRLNLDGITWDDLTTTTSTSYLDNQPQQNDTAKYRIRDNGSLGFGCYQPLMNSTIIANLTSHFPLCYTVNDNGSLDNDGTVTGNELYQNNTGTISFDFDGNSYVILPNESDYDFEHTDSFSVSVWVKTSTRADQVIYSKELSGGSGVGGYYLNESVGDGTFAFSLYDGSTYYQTVTTSAMDDGDWHHIVNTFSGNSNRNGMKMYVDGVLDSTGLDLSVSSSILNNVGLTIGAFNSGNQLFTGQIRDLMILDKELDSNEVAQLYHSRIDTSGLTMNPNAVNDLTGTATSFSTIELSWSALFVFGGIDGYQINYTTPEGDPTIIITNNTNTTGTDYEIFGLDEVTGYSFRVSAWNEFGNNATGNIFNATTTSEFIIGSINIPQTDNTDVVDITFTRNDINSTATSVVVQYPNTFNITCNIANEFGLTNTTYTNLSDDVVDTDYNSTTFIFNGTPSGEIIKFNCYDGDGANYTGGRYVVTQNSFPLLVMIDDFRNGTYGTQGLIGVIDFITLAVIILSMLGFSRENETVGLIFNIFLIGGFGYFGIIEVPTIVFGAIAVVVMFTITSTRKT